MALLSMLHIRKSFGGVPANNDISLDVEAGEILALLGENGAGKTTLMNILYGIYAAGFGKHPLEGEELGGHSPKEAIERGIGMVHQHFMMVPTLSASENITLGLKSEGHPFPQPQAAGPLDPGDLANLWPGRRPGCAGLPPFRRRAAARGDHEAPVPKSRAPHPGRAHRRAHPCGNRKLLRACWRGSRRRGMPSSSLRTGSRRFNNTLTGSPFCGTARRSRSSRLARAVPEELSRLMIGRELKEVVTARARRAPARPRRREAREAPGLLCDSLRLAERGLEKLKGVSLRVARGEIFGVAGVDGNGQKELAECILGLRQPAGGHDLLRRAPCRSALRGAEEEARPRVCFR